jgi:amino acid transporter
MKRPEPSKLADVRTDEARRFGWFAGVFTPDVLTILGVIMFLRLGWVVGNAGLLGAIAIIVLAKVITICTGLSMSSITTNIRIGAGGAYSIIAKSLGLEAGGGVGIPFYVSQTLSAGLYIFGFTEGWTMIFPTHDPTIVALAVWALLLGVSYFSTALALKIQYFVLAAIVAAVASFLLSPAEPAADMRLIGTFEDAGFWDVFAIFFPAVTGIMAGANLSGDLANPRKAIPLGTMSAVLVTMVIYIGLAWVLAHVVPNETLRNDQLAMVDYALSGPVVIVGVLAATFSSALGSIVGAPRVLHALAERETVPASRFFAAKSKSAEPRNAVAFTGAVIAVSLLLGDLDALAALITMFFLITYGMLNLVVFIQQSMEIISFRPTFKIPRFVPLLGAVGCVFVMFLINAVFSVVGLVAVVAIYAWLTRKGLRAEGSGDIRGGMFLALAEAASRLSNKFPRHQISWKPDLLVPIEDPDVWGGSLLFLQNITYPNGSVFAFTARDREVKETRERLEKLLGPLRSRNMHVHAAVIEEPNFIHGAKIVVQTLHGGALRPNSLFLTVGSDSKKDEAIGEIVRHAVDYELGVVALRQHPRVAFGMQKDVSLWLRDKSPNWHLAMLITLQLQMNWGGKINLVTVADPDKPRRYYRDFLESLSDQARLPAMTEFHILRGGFEEAIKSAPRADVNIFGLADRLDFEQMRRLPDLTQSSCLFVRDSGHESALA